MEYINMDLYLKSSDGYLGLGNLVVLCTRGSTPSRPWLCFFKRVYVYVCVCWIAFVAAQRSFWYWSRNPLVALCVSNRCRRGAVLGLLHRDLDDEICFSGLAQRSWQEVSPRDIAEGSLRENLYRHFISRSLIFGKDLAKRLPTERERESLYRDLATRPLLQIFYRNLWYRSLAEISPRGLSQRSS